MPDQKPITPFFSTDPRMVPQPSDQQEPKLCECHGEFDLDEIVNNTCATCGKPLIVEAQQ